MKWLAAALIAAVTLAALAGALWYWQWTRPWQAWRDYSRVFIQADGRVVDRTAADRSTSEGQAYSLFFALVADDRAAFERILRWTGDNLCAGKPGEQLPAWLWGRRDDGSWGVKDENPAADADLWIVYSLLEADRLWGRPDWRRLAARMLALIKARELAEIPGVGTMLLPAPQGFQLEDGSWRLNPSYLPEFQLRYLSAVDAGGPWAAVWGNHLRQMQALLRRGLAPDWYQISPAGAPVRDTVSGGRGSYDAIRVYLWAGLTEAGSTGGGKGNALLSLLRPYAALLAVHGLPPENLDFESGETSGGAPLGFSAAVLPFLARVDEDTAAIQRRRLKISRQQGETGNLGSPPHYYDQVLALFGEGWSDKRYQFDSEGRVIPRWSKTCCDWL
ncbi:MAG: cellulose synthase complex periplasmic endoglucanase BcsZ [Stagnimonas sp.]|nr:cellulose synthase complex periplasmic endoglucanase BcsZ [Stagnimonas sp.]